MVTMVVHNKNRFYNTFLIYNNVPGDIATIELSLCHSLLRSVILFNKLRNGRKNCPWL
jgi:hypothetical protein